MVSKPPVVRLPFSVACPAPTVAAEVTTEAGPVVTNEPTPENTELPLLTAAADAPTW